MYSTVYTVVKHCHSFPQLATESEANEQTFLTLFNKSNMLRSTNLLNTPPKGFIGCKSDLVNMMSGCPGH